METLTINGIGIKVRVEIEPQKVAFEDLILLERIAGRVDLPGYNERFDHAFAAIFARLIVSGMDPMQAHEVMQTAWPDHKA